MASGIMINIGSDNGLWHVRRQANTSSNADELDYKEQTVMKFGKITKRSVQENDFEYECACKMMSRAKCAK